MNCKRQVGNSTGCFCCAALFMVLASPRMLSTNDLTARQRIANLWPTRHRIALRRGGACLARATHGLLPEVPGASQFVLEIMPTLAVKLDFSLSNTKHTTSRFLTDNFNGFSMKPFTPRLPAACPPWRMAGAVEGSRPPQRLVAQADRRSSFELASCISNRHSPRLETLVSYRKQSIGPGPNRHKIAFCNFHHPCLLSEIKASFHLPPLLPLPPHFCSQLSTVNYELSFLIDNDMHSRENSCASKHSTYEFLIDNEFHLPISSDLKFATEFPTSLPEKLGLSGVASGEPGMVPEWLVKR